MAKRKSAVEEPEEELSARNKRSKRVEDEASEEGSDEENAGGEETDEEERAFEEKYSTRYLEDIVSQTQKTGVRYSILLYCSCMLTHTHI